MPPEHYEVIAHAQRDIDSMYTIRVNNVDPAKMDDETVNFYFANFGKIGDVCRPTDLKTRKYRNFMFIRYNRIQGILQYRTCVTSIPSIDLLTNVPLYLFVDALEAAKQMNYKYILGLLVEVEFVRKTCYFGQDETTMDPVNMSGFT